MENPKKKILITALAIVLIGSGIYFSTGGNFLQGRLTRDLNPTNQRPDPGDARETPKPIKEAKPTPTPAEPAPQRPEPPVPAPTPVEPEPAPAEPEPANPTPTETEPAVETPDNPAPADPVPKEPTPAEPAPEEDIIPAEELPVIFDTTNFTVAAVMDPQKGGGYSKVSKSTALRYSESENAEKDSYRISFYFPGYSGDEKPSKYTTTMSTVICKENTCTPAHTETVNVYKEPFAEGQAYSYFTVTRGELYNAVQTLGAKHEEKVDFKMQITDPNGEILTSSSTFNQKVEDDAIRKAFDLEGFKLDKGMYIEALKLDKETYVVDLDESFIQLNYTQTIGNTKEEIIYFYTGDQDNFKFFIEVCDAANPTICANYLETESTAIATIGGLYKIFISDLKTFTDGIGFTAGTKLLFKIAVQDTVPGAEKYYAKGFYMYMLQ